MSDLATRRAKAVLEVQRVANEFLVGQATLRISLDRANRFIEALSLDAELVGTLSPEVIKFLSALRSAAKTVGNAEAHLREHNLEGAL